MAGRGPAPKDPSKRQRRNKDVIPLRVVAVEAALQPPLPDVDVLAMVDDELVRVPFVWPQPTRDWWALLSVHPLAGEFTEVDWAYLLETARIHADFWNGNMKLGSELRLREAKYGFTPEDRLRLRMSFAVTSEAEDRLARKRDVDSGLRSRRGPYVG